MSPKTMIIAVPLAATFFYSISVGQDPDTTATLKMQVDDFFRHLNDESRDPQQVFSDFLKNGPLEGKDADVKGLVDKVSTLESKYGQFRAAESIETKGVGKDLVLMKYLYKMQRFPVVWYIIYYRTPRVSSEDPEWVVVSIRFDTRLELLGL